MQTLTRPAASPVVRRAVAAATLAVAAVAALPAAADPVPRDEGFIRPAPTVQGRKYTLDGKSDIGIFGALPVPLPLVEHYGAAIAYDRSFNEWLALDVFVDGGYGGVTNLVRDLRKRSFSAEKPRDDLRGSAALLATGQLGLRFTPFYGKLNLAAELPVHFNFYVTAGAGAAFVRYESVLACATTPGSTCPGDQFRSEAVPTFAFHGGIGLRFFINQLVSLRLELRDIVYPDRRNLRVDMRNPVATPGTVDPNPGLVQQPLILLGAGFLL